MKLTGTYNGQPIELELTEEQVKVLKQADKKKTGWERAKNNESYYVNYAGGCSSTMECFERIDTDRYEKANYFTDETLAKNIARAQTLQRKLWRRSAELCEKLDWREQNFPKYCIRYAYKNNNLYILSFWEGRGLGEIYFDTAEHAKQVMEEFRDELIWYFTEFQSRVD